MLHAVASPPADAPLLRYSRTPAQQSELLCNVLLHIVRSATKHGFCALSCHRDKHLHYLTLLLSHPVRLAAIAATVPPCALHTPPLPYVTIILYYNYYILLHTTTYYYVSHSHSAFVYVSPRYWRSAPAGR